AHLSAALPGHMVPAAYVALDALPVTPNGKLDRKALPSPEGTSYVAGEYEAPVGEIEARVARVWAEMLNLDRVGRNDNFFAPGGHSLLVTRAVSRLRQELGVEIGIAEFFNHPVLAEFAESAKCAASSVLPPITVIPRNQPLPLSFAQQRLWFLAQMERMS